MIERHEDRESRVGVEKGRDTEIEIMRDGDRPGLGEREGKRERKEWIRMEKVTEIIVLNNVTLRILNLQLNY